MHARLIALLDRMGSASSLHARKRAATRLRDEGLIEGGGLFCPPLADWFVIGGRWSGCLTWARIEEERLKAFWRGFHEMGGIDDGSEADRAIGEVLFKEHFPDLTGVSPFGRTSRRELGYEDDAQVLDEALWGFLERLGQYPIAADTGRLLRGGCFVNLDDPYEALAEEDIGRKWCVVVDFHY